ncbi:MAG TPA: LysR family transcriptional regulator [Roseiarcus sp.]|jgi:DNA-binding transcriptional LysR family regulator
MELRQLRYFLALARTLNFTRAAAESHIAQPPFSRQIRQLEEELGAPLIDRRFRQLRLTPAGELVRQHASEILARVDRMASDARLLEQTGQKAFRIGLETTILYGRLPALLRALREANPHLRIELLEMPPDKQADALNEGRIDIGFGRTRISDAALAQVLLREESFFAALPARHPLADAAPAPLLLRDLANETFIMFPAGTPHSLFAARSFRPKEVIEVGELQVALGLVAADYGVCIVPAVVQRMRGSDVCYRQLDEPGWTSPILMTWLRADQPPLVSSISDLLGKILTAMP